MIDRRSFLMLSAASATLPMVEAAKADSVAPPPDAWEQTLRDMEMFIRILREERATIGKLASDPTYAQYPNRDVVDVHCMTLDHCVTMAGILAEHSRRHANALLTEASGSKYHFAGT